MAAPRNRIGEVLVKARVIDEMQLRSALAQHDQWGGRLTRIISDMGIVTEDAMTQAISQGMGVQRVQLGNIQKDAGALAKLDVGFAEQKGVFPVGLRDNGKTLVLAMADPSDLQSIDQVAARSRTRVIPMVAGDREIEHAILRHYRNQEPNVTHSAHSSRRESAGQADADEFKIVDISGKTVMKAISDISPRLAEQNAREQAAAPRPRDPVVEARAPRTCSMRSSAPRRPRPRCSPPRRCSGWKRCRSIRRRARRSSAPCFSFCWRRACSSRRSWRRGCAPEPPYPSTSWSSRALSPRR